MQEAEFLAFDLEMSGIKNSEKLSRTDTPVERYLKTY